MFGTFGIIQDFNKKSTIKIKKSLDLFKKKSNKELEILKNTLNHGNLEETVQKPKKESENEWLAVNTVGFYNQTNLLYGTISEFCTPEKKSCKIMGGGSYEYLWRDETSEKYKRSTKVSAPLYINLLCDWISKLLNEEEFMPSNSKFVKDFVPQVKKIFERLFRVYVHIYYHHFSECRKLGIHKHLNTCFIHFILFAREYDLLSNKDIDPLKTTIKQLIPDYFSKTKKKKKKRSIFVKN